MTSSNPTYTLINDPISGELINIKTEDDRFIPINDENRDYQQYIRDMKNGVSNITCTDCGCGAPNDSMWQYLDNAEQLIIDKYGSDSDKLTALREDRYVRAMEAKTPYESKVEAYKIIDATPQEIKDKNRHLPMRR